MFTGTDDAKEVYWNGNLLESSRIRGYGPTRGEAKDDEILPYIELLNAIRTGLEPMIEKYGKEKVAKTLMRTLAGCGTCDPLHESLK